MKIILSIMLSLILVVAINLINQCETWTPSNSAIELVHISTDRPCRIKDRWRELLQVR